MSDRTVTPPITAAQAARVTPGHGTVVHRKPLTVVVATEGDLEVTARGITGVVDQLVADGDLAFGPVAAGLQQFVVDHQPTGVAAVLDVAPDAIAFLFDQAVAIGDATTHRASGRSGWTTVFVEGQSVSLVAGPGPESPVDPWSQLWAGTVAGQGVQVDLHRPNPTVIDGHGQAGADAEPGVDHQPQPEAALDTPGEAALATVADQDAEIDAAAPLGGLSAFDAVPADMGFAVVDEGTDGPPDELAHAGVGFATADDEVVTEDEDEDGAEADTRWDDDPSSEDAKPIDSEPEADDEPGAEVIAEAQDELDLEVEVEVEVEELTAEPETHAEAPFEQLADRDALADAPVDADVDADVETETETDVDIGADVDVDAETEIDLETVANGVVDSASDVEITADFPDHEPADEFEPVPEAETTDEDAGEPETSSNGSEAGVEATEEDGSAEVVELDPEAIELSSAAIPAWNWPPPQPEPATSEPMEIATTATTTATAGAVPVFDAPPPGAELTEPAPDEPIAGAPPMPTGLPPMPTELPPPSAAPQPIAGTPPMPTDFPPPSGAPQPIAGPPPMPGTAATDLPTDLPPPPAGAEPIAGPPPMPTARTPRADPDEPRQADPDRSD